MISRSTILHLRVLFSVFLMPVFLFALGTSIKPPLFNIVLVFVVLHLLIYPASNGFNSYFDKDEKSIGGLKNPPKVSKQLYYVSLLFDLIGILMAFLVNWQFALMVFIYGMISKAYSHPLTRIKKYPWGSWFIAGFFQGFFTFWMAYAGINALGFTVITEPQIFVPAALSSLVLWGSYPMTQIYQHEEDVKRGDITLSYKLGINGTFIFTGIVFLVATLGFFAYFRFYYQVKVFYWFLLFMAPILVFFNAWFMKVLKNPANADFDNTMKLNIISSLALSVFFVLLYLYANHFI
jgi:4-hydroxybenzoate polyprenyltransferase